MTWIPTNELRWLFDPDLKNHHTGPLVNGSCVLQQKWRELSEMDAGESTFEWRDVPVIFNDANGGAT